MSDMWAANANIDTIGNGIYLHSSINHSQHFVHPTDQRFTLKTIALLFHVGHLIRSGHVVAEHYYFM